MLIQFSLTNYRTFKETATLDLSEAKITEFPEHLYRDADGLGIIPMAAFYGANGSGKTNFLQGLWTLRQLVLDAPNTAQKHNHFVWKDSKTPVEYDILFRINDREYDYQLKLTPFEVVEENLFGRDLNASQFDVLFDRDSDGVFLCESWEDVDVSTLPDQYPLLYFLGVQTLESELQNIIQYFQNMIFLSETNNSSITKEETALKDILSIPTSKLDLLNHLKNMDFDITDICQQENVLLVTHTIQGKSYVLSWDDESTGIRKLLRLLATLMKARKEHTLVLADSPEITLHAKTLQYLYRYIAQNAAANSKSQVLFATHETSNMNHSIFRRDELWLVEKENDGSSHLYTLALFLKENGEKVRKDEVYFKQYLEGRYGAIPLINFKS